MDKYPESTYPFSKITQQIIGIGIKIHKQIGPGFREKYYQRAMYLEFQKVQIKFDREKKISLIYDKIILGYHIIDFVVENKIVVEIKSINGLTDVEIGQLTSYLRLTKCQIGLLLNFGKPQLEIKRIKI